MTSFFSHLRLPRRLRPVAALAVAFTAAVLPASARAEQIPSFVQDGTLTICTNPTLPPMTFVKGQDVTHPEGFDIDVAQALATRWHARLSVITMDFTGLFPSLSAQRCGLVMSGIIRTPAREKSFDAVSYQDTALVVVGRKATPTLSSMDELSGKDVAVESGTSYVTRLGVVNDALIAAGKPPMIIQQYPTEEQVVQQVLIGRVFAFVSQDVELFYRMRQLRDKLHVLITPDIPDYRHFAIYIRQNPEDRTLLQNAISALDGDGTLQTFRTKWSVTDQSTKGGAAEAGTGGMFDWGAFFSALTSMAFLHGAFITLSAALISHGIAIIISVPIAIVLNSPQKSLLKVTLEGYVSLFRAAPTLLQLLFIWNAVPQFFPIFREQWFTPFLATILALSINESAYQVEINRAALSAVDLGQELGASALGLSRRDIYWRVIFPQAFRIALPPTINEFINLLKITSLASVISLQELLAVTQIQVARTFAFTEYYAAALIYYLVMVFFFLFLQKRVERRFSWSDRKKVVSNAA
ncbi:MAG: ABC transporter substrate-binding protein/permease [Acetobacter sp.]|jgi:polar amino acid transport system substrate-binding protein|uniref:Polar amino acid transport system substrate-binding protein n=1 Tax=Acetobacter lovaniensis TaxID=104100 RepID=A0A841QEZ9_9PROT|nr:ABC transporter substrate-binding protein/permease [Acetobacter lovaniensis]MBB6456667.1 polar amino acid transport system substrate-binding protein [Acetobacter lovaniensis]MCI1795467.1 ABC transporter substrate-binding protein/permease [Acetobacter lovaniensis]MCP1239254.1 ABC transporter substrate-binding protein/permease [Acetobacter lovaniensis]NHN81513.1 ABC transporter permease subunit [Acetobacter lovaniensis]GBQ65442.1 ABC transporter amino acid transporter permease [Acetobacter lo